MSVNKSKIVTAYDKNFMPKSIKKIPRSRLVYLKSDTPSNGSPRTAYDSRALNKHFKSQLELNRPLTSPVTRKPVTNFYNKLYTREEIESAKKTKSNRYRLIEHMKTRKTLSAKQKLGYLNQLNKGTKLNDVINNVNRFTVPKQNINLKTHDNVNNLQMARNIMNSINTTGGMLKPINQGMTSNNNMAKSYFSIFKRVRTLILKEIHGKLKGMKNNRSRNQTAKIDDMTKKYRILFEQIERAIFAVSYMETESVFSEIDGMKDVKKTLYDIIEKNIFKKDGIRKIRVQITASFQYIIYGDSVSRYNLYLRANELVRFMSKGTVYGFYGETLEYWLKEDYDVAVDDIPRLLNDYNINKNALNKIEPIDVKTKKILKNVAVKYHPKNKNALLKKINAMKTPNYENISYMLPKST